MAISGDEAIKWIQNLDKFGSKPGLERINWLLTELNHPHNHYPVIHVAGTNGKGSTCSILESLLSSMGYQVGLFTSPFIDDFAERVTCNSKPITKTELGELVCEIKPIVEAAEAKGLGHPTQFEVITALALLYFQKKSPDMVILETGLGGRLDATNVVTPVLSIITSIGYDHINVLGNTLTKIAEEKAGIIKENIPVITGLHQDKASIEEDTQEQAFSVIEEKCQKKGSPLYASERNWNYRIKAFSSTGYCFDYFGLEAEFINLKLPLLGESQIKNASMALCALELLKKQGWNEIDWNDMRKGMVRVNIPARMEFWPADSGEKTITGSRAEKQPDVLLDASHNPPSVQNLMSCIRRLDTNRKWNKIVFVTGVLQDKPMEKIVANFSLIPDEIVVTEPQNTRALSAHCLLDYITDQLPDTNISVESDLYKAVRMGISKAGNGSLLVIFGSFYLVVEARRYLKTDILA
ncbi:bifunctional folylpolyglutamate synthase/dihydrofolate synthase [Natranaerobius thermophilus]|uniref:tetrahydrofolate synthase n=1 Tax=Natranaerobius thermophilus (strain ATCC BAA-1301 / DSM 18059 / JW/NM-WN-LF) TaxID=457570 RepID=B2A1F3_NATTJ|nr:folylpolyglutamate synthase/dihydrofolate synthase family protein [Natranaerobius thermophilus]ACB84693.1 FolC bifunctional protein [Natranaerobius thermophilus JW/NM-WN-LF]